MLEVQKLYEATKQKHLTLFNYVQDMRVRQKRHLFLILRSSPGVTSNTFLPVYGLHCGEFACLQIITEHNKKERRESK